MNRLAGQRVLPVLLLVHANAGQARRPVLRPRFMEAGALNCMLCLLHQTIRSQQGKTTARAERRPRFSGPF